MFKHLSWKSVCVAGALAGLVSLHSIAAEKNPPAASRLLEEHTESGEAFMHAKLKATHQIVDGLAFEDYARIEQGADELLRITEMASWKVRRDPIYMHYAADFEQTATRLLNAARARSIEKATFAYMHLTVSCTACHHHVRNVVQIAPAADAAFQPGKRPVFR